MQLLGEESKETTQHTNVTQHKMNRFYPPKPKINAFNELFTCYLCRGYMINPTTVDICMHTYCRSCIARHLAVDCYCPQCKHSGGKTINISNLKTDDVLRSVIFKLVPGLYQKERENLVQFVNNTKNEGNLIGSTQQSLNELLETEENLFSPTDPISLSLEYHPVLAEQCPEGAVPPVRYLQCPASVKIQHLKRFLCSKFDIDPCNKRVGIDIIYDDEILPSDFTLMDVGYCYKWERHAPLKFTYRILIYNEDNSPRPKTDNASDGKVSDNPNKASLTTSSTCKTTTIAKEKTPISVNGDKEVKITTPSTPSASTTTPPTTKVKSSKSSSTKTTSSSSELEIPKVTISRKSSDSKKTTVSKKSSSSTDEFVLPTTTTNDFKSLRSNDIRYSDYAITSSTTNTTTSISSKNNSCKKEKPLTVKEEKPSKCDIVVSIPHNQMHDEWESKNVTQLKTASKKSPNSSSMENAIVPAKKTKNVPKLKIELNSLRTKLIEKPKSADIRLDILMGKQHRPRKFSLDEPQPVMDKVDLETYVKNIGLKPIEVQTTIAPATEVLEKLTPNASPKSSSSSTTSSGISGNFNFSCGTDITATSSSSSSHKKRKKKHSKDSRESKDSKRKKMHAEISSHSAEESLKMKVKLTPPINMKALRLESKKSPPVSVNLETPTYGENKFIFTAEKSVEKVEFEKPKSPERKTHERSKDKSKSRSDRKSNNESKKSKYVDIKPYEDSKKLKDLDKSKPLEIKIALTQPSAMHLPTTNTPASKAFEDDEDLVIPDTTTSLSFSKSLTTIKESHLPHSPPLPPSLFKTTPLSFSTFSPNVTTVAKPKAVAMPKESKDKPKTPHMKPIAPKPIAAKPIQPSLTKSPQFAVPNPPRFMANNSTKFLSTPTSIASSANKHLGNLLKRSMSLDDKKAAGSSAIKQAKLEKPNQITVSAYGNNLHKVEIPATPTSSTAKATYEIPLYSPLSASYNPKCSFSVNTSMSAVKTAKVSIQDPVTPNATSTGKQTYTTNVATNNKGDVEVVKKTTANDIKLTTSTTVNTTNKNNSNNNKCNKSTTLMGPPLPMQKLNTSLTVVPATVQSSTLTAVLPFTAATKTQHTPVLNTAYLSSPLSMVNYRQSKVLLAHGKPTTLPELKTETTATTTTDTTTTTNGLATEKAKSSLRQFRLPSRDSGQDILDLSASAKASSNGMTDRQPLTPPTTPIIATTTGSTLEMALNKIKQNMTGSTTNVDSGIKKQEHSPISDDLQNLHLLSESATAREKIAIGSSSSTSTSTSLYEKPKMNQNSLVRQQNASVRNIPNPSALAFRNQQPNTIMPPMVTISAAALSSNLNSDTDKSLILKQPSPPKSPQSPNCSTSSTSPSRSSIKKHPSIDQVAASLNIRASAAAKASAKGNSKHTDETSLVTSTSSSLMEKAERKEIKQETTESLQSEISTAQPSSTVNTGCLGVVEIKKEPEDKIAETYGDDATEIKSVFVNSIPKKPSKVEGLVTSVINVTTPTATLLTASSAGY